MKFNRERERYSMGKYVTLIEVGQKQSYIFASNRLAENLGASIIIRQVTERDPEVFYKEETPQVIYEGGGKALYVFRTPEKGIAFAKKYSRFVLETYPGLLLYIVGCEVRDEESVKEGLDRCYRLLEKKKTAGFSMHRRMIDYGGSLRCAETNLPAVSHQAKELPEDRQEKPISAESLAKYRRRLDQTEYFRDILPPGWQFPLRMDQLGGTLDEKKYIAVVHIDGNRMRDKIARFNQSMERKSGETGEAFDRRYIQGQGSLSREIDEKYRGAFLKLNQRLAKIWECLREDLDMEEGVLPIRPLILAGDDICYVTDGRIALETARIFLEYIQQENVQGLPLNACAGVAVVKAHFPFSRAYQLAEKLCRNAKNQIPEGTDASWLDWHVDQGELQDSLQEVREQYTAEDGSVLTQKPYSVEASSPGGTIQNFLHVLEALGGKTVARSKVLGLREVMHRGKAAVRYALQSNRMLDQIRKLGWSEETEQRDSLYDAMEMMDLYISLEEKKK